MPGKEIFTYKNFPFENLIMDIVLLACYYFLLDRMVAWQTDHLALAGIMMVALNIATAAFGIFTFFSIYSSEHDLKNYKKLITSFEGAVIAISALITFVAGFWWLVPYQAIKKTGGFEIYNGLTMLIYFVVCLLVLAKAMDDKKYYVFSRSRPARFISVLLNGSFFFFSYALLIVSLHIWQPVHLQYQFYGIACLVVFYLPFRIFLLLRPPFHQIEFVTMIATFTIMIVNLFSPL